MAKPRNITLPLLFAIGATRGLLGIGIGLLASSRLPVERRRTVGGALLAVGALSTIPLALRFFRRRRDDSVEAGDEPLYRVEETYGWVQI